jgi:hypothetical protein
MNIEERVAQLNESATLQRKLEAWCEEQSNLEFKEQYRDSHVSANINLDYTNDRYGIECRVECGGEIIYVELSSLVKIGKWAEEILSKDIP